MITVIANLKGGTGKSTVTFNLAVWLRAAGRRTTVIDLDPQRTLSDVVAVRTEEGIEPAVTVEAGHFSDVSLPADAEEIIIDVGTADLGSFKQAVMIADRILIPVTPSQADIWSTQRFVRFLYKNTHGNPPESLTFLNRVDTNKGNRASDEAAAALDALPGVSLMPHRLSDRQVFRDSFSEGLAVFELEPRSVASREFNALAQTMFPHGHRSMLDRLRKQKSSAVEDETFREALELPSEERGATDRVGIEEVSPAPVAEMVHANAWDADDGMHQKAREGKKRKKDGKGKKRKEGKKARKSKKGKKGKRKA